MASRWRAVAVGTVSLGAIVCAVGLVLPAHWEIAEVVEVAAAPGDVFELVDRADGLATWVGGWTADPSLALVPGDEPERGVGALLHWQSGETRIATLRVTESEPPERVAYVLGWANGVDVEGEFRLQPTDAGTRVTWLASGELGLNPVTRWMGVLMGRSLADDFGRGLDALRGEAERRAEGAAERAVLHGAPIDLEERATHGSGAAYEGP